MMSGFVCMRRVKGVVALVSESSRLVGVMVAALAKASIDAEGWKGGTSHFLHQVVPCRQSAYIPVLHSMHESAVRMYGWWDV